MTADEFKQVTGREPEGDDLERANCNLEGQPGHSQCGLCRSCHKPRFLCTCGKRILRMIPVDERAGLVCCKCGETRSVKYRYQDTGETICNACVFR